MRRIRFLLILAPWLLAAQERDAALIDAARKGDLAAVERLLEAGANPSAREKDTLRPALSVAAVAGHPGLVKALAAKAASPNEADKFGYPPLVWAVWSQRPSAPEVIRTLMGLGADPDLAGSDGKAAPWVAAELESPEKLEALLSGGLSVNWRNRHQETLLAIASAQGRVKAVQLLLERGANVNTRDDEGFTPLLNACQNAHLEVVRLLIAKGADRAAKSKYGDTALSLVQTKYDDTQAGRTRRAIAELLREP